MGQSYISVIISKYCTSSPYYMYANVIHNENWISCRIILVMTLVHCTCSQLWVQLVGKLITFR